MDLSMFFGAKKKRKSTRSVLTDKCAGSVVVRGRTRKLYRGSAGGLYYKTKSGKRYVDKADAKRMMKKSPKKSPKRKSPKRKSPKRKSSKRKSRYGYGLGQPSLLDMMGPAGLSVVPHPVAPVAPGSGMKFGMVMPGLRNRYGYM
jgi:hypothetical protein